MDYQFFWDTTEQPVAKCELDMELFGDWLTNDIGAQLEQIQLLLAAIEQLLNKQQATFNYTKGDYHLRLDADEAELTSRFSQVFEEELPEGTELDEHMACGCGLEDLHHLLINWRNFINKQ